MARSKIKHFKGFSVVDGDIRIKLDMHRFEEQFRRAQYQLDGAVMNSMVPFMPMITGSFINTTRAASAAIQGSGEVYARLMARKADFCMRGKRWLALLLEAHMPKREKRKYLSVSMAERQGPGNCCPIQNRHIPKRNPTGLTRQKKKMERPG